MRPSNLSTMPVALALKVWFELSNRARPSGTLNDPRSRRRHSVIPFPNHACALPASLAVHSYCLRLAFALTNDWEMESRIRLLRLHRRAAPRAAARRGARCWVGGGGGGGAELGGDLGFVGQGVGGVAAQHDVFHARLHGGQGLGVAVDVEPALGDGVEHLLGNGSGADLAAAHGLVAHGPVDALALGGPVGRQAGGAVALALVDGGGDEKGA